MPNYIVVIKYKNQKKVVKTLQPSNCDAEYEVKNQFPGCEIISIGREGENNIISTNKSRLPQDGLQT